MKSKPRDIPKVAVVGKNLVIGPSNYSYEIDCSTFAHVQSGIWASLREAFIGWSSRGLTLPGLSVSDKIHAGLGR